MDVDCYLCILANEFGENRFYEIFTPMINLMVKEIMAPIQKLFETIINEAFVKVKTIECELTAKIAIINDLQTENGDT